jgi:hypothetical protein
MRINSPNSRFRFLKKVCEDYVTTVDPALDERLLHQGCITLFPD